MSENGSKALEMKGLSVPYHLVMIQFIGQFPRQTESAEKAVQGPLSDDMVLGVDDPQHQFPLWLFQPPDQLRVAGLDFLLVLS